MGIVSEWYLDRRAETTLEEMTLAAMTKYKERELEIKKVGNWDI